MKLLHFLFMVLFLVCSYPWSAFANDLIVVPIKPQFKSWNQKLDANKRFELVLDGEAVLDKETGLVWKKTVSAENATWDNAVGLCYAEKTGGRMGWRLPAIEELMSLVDPLQSTSPPLPNGHPFEGVTHSTYWSITSCQSSATSAYALVFLGASPVILSANKAGEAYVWCVRGGYGPSPQP